MVTDLVQIKRFGEKNREENKQLRAWMRRHNFAERRLKAIAEDIQDQIDCTACANCCRVTEVGITEKDVEKLARFIGTSEREFVDQFTALDNSGAMILKKNEAGCVFLEGNLCSVYEARPHNCANFPHVVRGTGSIASRMWEFVDRVNYCPIIYNWMEKVKDDIGFR